MRVCIDPGHGGRDSGAVGPTGIEEADVNLTLACRAATRLRELGHQVYLTRNNNTDPSLARRVALAHKYRVDAFVSIHCNSDGPDAHGYEVWTTVGDTPADRLAIHLFGWVGRIFPGLTGRIDMEDGDPDKESRFFVLRKTRMPAVLLECLFLSNAVEEHWSLEPGTQAGFGEAVAMAVTEFGRELTTRSPGA